MRQLLVILLFSSSLTNLAQNSKKESAAITVRGVIGIPKGISSTQFRKSFAGLYEANLSLNFRLPQNFFIGAGYQSSFFKNNDAIKYKYYNASVPYNTQLVGNSGFVKIGYDYFFSKGFLSCSINTGYSFFQYKNVNQDSSLANQPFVGTAFTAPFIQPEIAINFLADRSMSFSFILSYTTLFYHFDAKAPRFNQFEEINKESNSYVMGWINIGFGFNVLINRK